MIRPKVGDTWKFKTPKMKRSKTKTIGRIRFESLSSGKRRLYVDWERWPKGRYSGVFIRVLLKYGIRISEKKTP